MEIKEEFTSIVNEIISDKSKKHTTTPRNLLRYFSYEKRTSGNKARIDKYLESKNLVTEPDYKDFWIDSDIVLKHKDTAKTKSLDKNPILHISILPSANKPLVTINRDAKISEAVTLMMMHNFSQLPVMSNPRSVEGFISWETIGTRITNGNTSQEVKDFLEKDVTILPQNYPLLEAIKIVLEKGVVLVKKVDNNLAGIITITDISSQFFALTEPFLLLERIENLIRLLLNDIFLIEDLKKVCIGDEEPPMFIDDLTFGQYIRLIESENNWNRLNLKIERKTFIKQLDNIRKIRNDVMHFDTEGITDKQRDDLNNMASFLTKLVEYKNQSS